MIKVKFIKEINTYTKENEILAVFPEIFENQQKTEILCYTHQGQHSSVSLDYIKHKRKANKEEYFPLLNELKNIGYNNLIVINERN